MTVNLYSLRGTVQILIYLYVKVMISKQKYNVDGLVSKDKDGIKVHRLVDAFTDISENKKLHENAVISIEHVTPRKANPSCSKFGTNSIIHTNTVTSKDRQCFDTSIPIPNEENHSMGETLAEQCSQRQCIDARVALPMENDGCTEEVVTDISTQNDTGTRFLNELFDKEVDIKKNFSDQETLDIRTAVHQMMTLLTDTIGEIDPRFKLREVIPVGSARERTQIVRPCEYDFILIIDALSKPGAVSLKCSKNDQQYMTVTLEDNEVRSVYDGCNFKPTEELSKSELRNHFRATVFRVLKRCSKLSVNRNTGTLTCKPFKPQAHGPADTVLFEWKSKFAENCLPMKISVDLVLALKIDYEKYNDILQSVGCEVSADFKHHIQTVGSVLFIVPMFNGLSRFFKVTETLFKVAFTEAELLLTAELSEHHIKCYKLLKYVVNGEPLPLPTKTSRLKYFFQDNTFLPSYALKLVVWRHQFTNQCSEEIDLGSCFSRILSICDCSSQLEDGLKHPMKVGTTGGGTELLKSISNGAYNTTLQGQERIRRVLKGFKKVQKEPVEQYNFEKFCDKIAIRGLGRCYASRYTIIYALIVYLLCCSQVVCTGYFAFTELTLKSVVFWVLGSIILVIATVIIHYFSPQNMLVSFVSSENDIGVVSFKGSLCSLCFYVTGLMFLCFIAHGLTFYLVVVTQGILLGVLNVIGQYCVYLRLKSFMTSETNAEN